MTKTIRENKKKIITSAILVLGVALAIYETKDRSQAQEKPESSKIVTVRVEKAGDSQSYQSVIKYPATVAGDQEITVTAQFGGVATYVGFDLGDQVGAGKMLAKIDDIGLDAGASGFRSGDVQQLELAEKQAKKSWSLAKKEYSGDKTNVNKTAKEIAKLQYESADLALRDAVNGRQVKAPISGIVTSRNISMGDSVAPGQPIATISKSNKIKIQFYVNQDELANIKLGTVVKLMSDEEETPAKVINISPQADSVTRRFLIEAIPDDMNGMIIGSILNVAVNITETANGDNGFILPLDAVTITPTESYIYILDGDQAKKIPVSISKVTGETAQVKADISFDSQIIVEGNKLIKDGEKVQVN